MDIMVTPDGYFALDPETGDFRMVDGDAHVYQHVVVTARTETSNGLISGAGIERYAGLPNSAESGKLVRRALEDALNAERAIDRVGRFVVDAYPIADDAIRVPVFFGAASTQAPVASLAFSFTQGLTSAQEASATPVAPADNPYVRRNFRRS